MRASLCATHCAAAALSVLHIGMNAASRLAARRRGGGRALNAFARSAGTRLRKRAFRRASSRSRWMATWSENGKAERE